MKQITVYQGLFLMTFALYAYERNQAHPILIQKEIRLAAVPGEIPTTPEISALSDKLKIAHVFNTPVDGVTLHLAPRSITIRIQSDELYHADDIAIEDTWLPVLDQIGSALFEGEEPKVGVTFLANANFDKDAFMVSSSRADWVMRYLERKYRFRLDQGRYTVMGLGKNTDQTSGRSISTVEIVLKPEGER